MGKAQVIGTIRASAPRVWDLVGNFGRIAKWVPWVAESRVEGEGIGMRRYLTLVNGASLIERLDEMNEAERYYRYSLVEGALPVTAYSAALWIRPAFDSASSTIEWAASFTPREDLVDIDVQRQIEGILQAGIDNLRRTFGD
jgi:hypothetical protein